MDGMLIMEEKTSDIEENLKQKETERGELDTELSSKTVSFFFFHFSFILNCMMSMPFFKVECKLLEKENEELRNLALASTQRETARKFLQLNDDVSNKLMNCH